MSASRINTSFEREGGQSFYLIREGKVALEVAAERPRRIMETAAEGEVLGWSWLVAPYRWHFDARAVGPVRAIAIDGKCLRAKCQKHHDLGYELLRRTVDMVGQRLEAEHFRLLDLYSAEGPLEPKVTSDRDF